MKRVFMVLLAVAFLPGCSYILPQADQPPNAYIDAITPSEVTEGDVVSFLGHGTDTDGQVVAYSWRSDLDGQLSTASTFDTSSLSVGDHEIFFMVQDNNDEWSAEATDYITVLAKVVAPANVDSFTSSSLAIPPGASVTLSWSASNATTVSIDQGVGTVSAAGSMLVTPGATTTYKLTATGTMSTASAALTIAVQQSSVRQVRLTPDTEYSGYVRSSGASSTGYVYVGDDSANRDFQGFMTFDISRIPDNATITKVILDLSDYEIPYSSPFPALGCLTAYTQDYFTLGSNDYWSGSLSAPLGEWCSAGDLGSPADMSGFRKALQARVGENVFQFRLQFAESVSDGDAQDDLLRWLPDWLPTLTVEYYS